MCGSSKDSEELEECDPSLKGDGEADGEAEHGSLKGDDKDEEMVRVFARNDEGPETEYG